MNHEHIFMNQHLSGSYSSSPLKNFLPCAYEVSDSMLWKYFCVKYICGLVKGNHRKNLQTVKKECQLNRAKPPEVKDNSYKLSKTNDKSAKYSYLPPN